MTPRFHRRLPLGLILVAGLCLPAAGTRSEIPEGQDRAPAAEIQEHLADARALGLYRDPIVPILKPVLATRAQTDPGARTVAWVHFTDKGIGTRLGFDRALARFRDGLAPAAARRRAALGPGLGADFRDLPVCEAYVRALDRAGYRVRRVSRWTNAASVEAPAGLLPALASFRFVREVRPLLVKRRPAGGPGPELLPEEAGDSGVLPRQLGTQHPPAMTVEGAAACVIPVADSVEAAFYGPSYNQLGEIQVLDLHRLGYSGAGVRVMVLDTGFLKTHPAFAHIRWIAEWDFVNEDGQTGPQIGDASSQHYHGTGVWGTAGAYAPGALIGPAFAAEWVLAKTEDVVNEVHAEEDNYVAALEWADTLGVDVTTASLAYFTFDDSSGYTVADLDGDTAVITQAVDIAVSKGIACVNSASNSGPNPTTIWTPADADSVIAVGAVDSCGVVQSFSSRGPTADLRIKPDISARGRNTYWARAWSGGYGAANGTSLSAPLIGGLAALLKEAHPDWNGAQIREALIGTGTHSGVPNNDIGYGIARGLDALTFGGAAPAPPRMTLPFTLLAPAHGAVLTQVKPTLLWHASASANPGEEPVYRVLVDDGPTFAAAETVYTGPDTTYTFVLAIEPGTTRWWRVEAVGDAGFVRRSLDQRAFTVSSVLAAGPPQPGPSRYALGPASPNPLRTATRFAVEAPAGAAVTVEILTVSGRRVRRLLVTGTEGPRQVVWDRRDEAGERVPAGVYFYRLQGGPFSPARKMLVLP